jgi:hypothetical protein
MDFIAAKGVKKLVRLDLILLTLKNGNVRTKCGEILRMCLLSINGDCFVKHKMLN